MQLVHSVTWTMLTLLSTRVVEHIVYLVKSQSWIEMLVISLCYRCLILYISYSAILNLLLLIQSFYDITRKLLLTVIYDLYNSLKWSRTVVFVNHDSCSLLEILSLAYATFSMHVCIKWLWLAGPTQCIYYTPLYKTRNAAMKHCNAHAIGILIVNRPSF